jgi:hypothetical protein
MVTAFLIIFLLAASNPALSISVGGKILRVSRTNRSIVWNRGTLGGVETQGQLATFIFKDEKVAKGEVVKVFPDKSYWVLSDIKRPDLIAKGQFLQLLWDYKVLGGRTPERIQRKMVVLSKKGSESTVEDYVVGVDIPEGLVKFQGVYQEADLLKVSTPTKNQDGEMLEFAHWLEDGLRAVEEYDEVVDIKKIGAPEQKADFKKLRQKEQKKIVDSVVEGLLQKRRGMGVEKSFDPRINRLQQKEGPLWSADLNDRDLRRYMLESGMMEEKKRQRFFMENRYMNEFIVKFNKTFPQARSSQTSSNQADSYSWALGYELHLMRLTSVLRSFSLGFFLELGNGYYEVELDNLRSSEFTVDLSLSWYFLSYPSTIGKLLGHIGLGSRLGESYLDSSEVTKSYKYQVWTFPWYFVEFKYRFENEDNKEGTVWGLGFGLGYLNTELTAMETLIDDIRGRYDSQELRWSFGLYMAL